MFQINVRFEYLKNKFLRISEAKIKEGIFVGPHIRQLIQDVKFEDQIGELGGKKQHGNHSKVSLTIFEGNHKLEICRDGRFSKFLLSHRV
jgi:hypothetical protein